MSQNGKRGYNSLNSKQKTFVEEYVVTGNALQSAIRAGYSERSAPVTSARLLEKANIKQAVIESQNKFIIRQHIKQDDIVAGLASIATADRTLLFQEDGSLKPVTEWPEHVKNAIESITTDCKVVVDKDGNISTKTYIKDVKFSSRTKAYELLGKHFGMFEEKLRVTHDYKGKTPEEIRAYIKSLDARLEQVLEIDSKSQLLPAPKTDDKTPE